MTDKGTLVVTGMHCPSCSILIDETLEELPGVVSSSTDLRRETTTVEYDPAQTDLTAIADGIAALGYAVHCPTEPAGGQHGGAAGR
jgi:copper chaperone